MKREITTTVEVDGEIYIFRIQREETKSYRLGPQFVSLGELTITTTPGPNTKIQELIDVIFDKASQIL